MGGIQGTLSRFVKLLVAVLILIPVAHGLNLGLISGDLKRHSSPLLIKKVSKLSPVFINIKPGLSISLPKLPPKPPPIKQLLQSTAPSKKVTRSILPPLWLPPILPKLPFLHILPLLPPILPPLLPGLPLLPPPLPILPPLPLLPPFRTPLKPLRVPILKRSPRKVHDNKLKLVKVPPLTIDIKKDIRKKLFDLKKKGSLTTPEYVKFKKLLLN